jgi:hypothetical protein
MAHAAHNERAKLIANALDRGSTGCFAAGIFAPVAGALLGQPVAVPLDVFLAAFIIWLICGVILHVEARRVIATVRD